ncbi:MAG: PPOX class F420-dependent oxidoreductase [Gammaproteobacteria bacterium]|nr:PPOX class F420-dependent oxidoreductase [Gammaproteobacteria bacterium]
MPTVIPEAFKDLVTTKITFAHLATTMRSGSPQVTPVWFSFDGTHIVVNSAKGRLKDRNMRARPQVALSILDPENAYRYLQIIGQVVDVTEQGGDAHIDSLAKKYLGKDTYPWRSPTEVRVIYKILPEKVQTMG